MKKAIAKLTIVSLLLSGSVFAKHGFGNPGGGMPPGLQGKDMPKGLQMQGKTPAGWSKGKKTGWHKKHHKKNKNLHKNRVF